MKIKTLFLKYTIIICIMVVGGSSDKIHANETYTSLNTVSATSILKPLTLPEESEKNLNKEDTKVYIALRDHGKKLGDSWSNNSESPHKLLEATNLALNEIKQNKRPNSAEIVIAYDFAAVSYAKRKSRFSNIRRGIIGIELSTGSHLERYGPTEMIARNLRFDKLIDQFITKHDLSDEEIETQLKLQSFSADQYLLNLDNSGQTIPMFRGNTIVSQEMVTQKEVEKLVQRMSNWMASNVKPSGQMTYKYWPSRGEYSTANSMIRQWMATVCLIRISDFYDDKEIEDLARLNIRYNFNEYYQKINTLGFIEYNEKIKLGAVALAALAVDELPNSSEFQDYNIGLKETVFSLWRDNGAFITFLKPLGRNDNQNFYPGEALVYIANLYSNNPDPELLKRIQISIDYYRDWHLENRNPAFIPWHTMAYEKIWQRTKDPKLAEWIFEMNDWLLTIQPISSSNPDTAGRFYDPNRPHFGVPHASSTGVYLEGLIQAYKIAKAVDDEKRATAYRSSILRGIRRLMQLEFKDNIDIYYISKPERVIGGLRTTVYDNEIRVDNIQHGLMALLEIIRIFNESDYTLPVQ